MAIVFVLLAVALIVFCSISIRIHNIPDQANAFIFCVRYLFLFIRKEIHLDRDGEESIAFNEYKKGGKKKKITGFRSLYLLYRKYKKLPIFEQQKLLRAVSYIMLKSHVRIKELRVKMGMGDAALTSILAGAVIIALNTVFAMTGKFKAAKDGETKVIPVYGKELFHVDLHCIIHIKPVHIIIGYFKFLLKRR
jgi:uncharacterized protein YxeA